MIRCSRFRLAVLMFGVFLAAAAIAQQVATKLIVNGAVASTTVRMIGGRPYVALADVAKALNYNLVERPGAYELVVAGGANEVQGLRGKIGQVLFNGKWRFEVLDAATADTYTMQNKSASDYSVYNSVADLTDNVYSPKAGNTLYVVKCQLKNGLHDNQALWRYNNDTHTALTDDKGQSYPPIAFDMPEAAPFQSKAVLPGAALDVTVVFAVPSGTTPKDLVFTLRTLSEKGGDVRVSLVR